VAAAGVDLKHLAEQPADYWTRLAVFDDSTFETRSPAEWAPRGAGVPRPAARVAARTAAGVIVWVPCKVLDYGERGDDAYLVDLSQPLPPAADMPAVLVSAAAVNSEQPAPVRQSTANALDGSNIGDGAAAASLPAAATPMWQPRLCLCFDAEDPAAYACRLASAIAQIRRMEAAVSRELVIACMPTEDVPLLSTEQVNRVLNRALNSRRLRERLMDASALVNEANMEHARALNRATLRALMMRQQAATLSDHGGDVDGGSSNLMLLSLPEVPPPACVAAPVPHQGTITLPQGAPEFPQLLSDFAFRTLLSRPEAISALAQVHSESAKLLKLCLFSTTTSKSMRLEEFEQAQQATMDGVANHLRDVWVPNVRAIIRCGAWERERHSYCFQWSAGFMLHLPGACHLSIVKLL
jgi:dynein heavy chain, axonemal